MLTASVFTLPLMERPSDYDPSAAQRVTWALGHQRIDVVLRHYLR